MRIKALAVTVLAIALLSGCSATTGSTDNSEHYVAGDGSTVILAPAERDPAITLSGKTLDGAAWNLAEHKGHVVVVNVWASWCAPCRGEAAALEKVHSQVSGKGVEFVGVVSGSKDSVDNARAFVDRFDISYPSMFDSDNSLILAFGRKLPPSAIPTTLVLDGQGRVAARALGPVTESRLLGIVEPVIRESHG
ncbi:MAG: TlpA disulfide reductase family protein [Actinomycetes bacterium]|jgi:thiol-disulfide isomerase/thioredoxin